jgi:predicted DNA-binding transcriptional regulator AlpA
MAEPTAKEFLTKRELAELCRCSERTVDRLLENGDAPPVTHLSSRRIIFHAPSALEWLAKRTVAKVRPHERSVPSSPPRPRGRPRKSSSAAAERTCFP